MIEPGQGVLRGTAGGACCSLGIGDGVASGPTVCFEGPDCPHALLWLQGLPLGMCMAVEAADGGGNGILQVHSWRVSPECTYGGGVSYRHLGWYLAAEDGAGCQSIPALVGVGGGTGRKPVSAHGKICRGKSSVVRSVGGLWYLCWPFFPQQAPWPSGSLGPAVTPTAWLTLGPCPSSLLRAVSRCLGFVGLWMW